LLAGTALTVTATSAAAAPAATEPSYKVALKATLHVGVPADAMRNGWCYDAGLVDPATHDFYLANTADKAITVFSPTTGKATEIGAGLFTGINKCHANNFDAEGPNGLAIADGVIYAGNGDSRVLGFSLKTGRLVADYDTGGKLQADELTVAGRYLVVTNSAEKHPFISFIDLRRHRLVARYTFADATGGLGGVEWWRGHLYVSVAATKQSPAGGEVEEFKVGNVHRVALVRQFKFASCGAAGLSITETGLAAVGCGNPPDQEILNVVTGKETAVPGIPGVDLVAADGGDFFYVSFFTNQFFVVNAAGKVLQAFTTKGASHTVAVDRCDGDVWVPEDKGVVNRYAPVRLGDRGPQLGRGQAG
jgi:outer membrane protein assembly factor BamB